MMKWIPLLLVCSLTAKLSLPQNLASFIDYRDCFYIFDNRVTRRAEYQPVKSYKTGMKCVAYVNNLGHFKVYFNGDIIELEKYNIIEYFTTDNLVVYKADNELIVFDNGVKNSLVYYPEFYGFGDSVVAFYDQASKYLNVYYQGRIIPIGEALVGSAAKSMRVGANLVAFKDNDNYLKVFYHGKIFESIYFPQMFKAGRNVVAYIDATSSEFGIFYRGESLEAEPFKPMSFKTGNEMVVYVNYSGSFKVFYEGETFIISSFEPEFYIVKDNIVLFGEGDFFKVFYKGEVYLLENYIPVKYYVDNNTVAYIDQFGFLHCFYNGETYQLSDEAVSKVVVAGNTVSYTQGLNTKKVFSGGEIY